MNDTLNRRAFIEQLGSAFAATSLGLNTNQILSSESKVKPNVLFLMSDDMRVELGCYNSRFGAKTPHLDALAKSGVKFENNYCQFPLCNPSRTSLLTGRHPTTTRVLGNRTAFRDYHPDWISLPQLFKNNGYKTFRSGKIFHGGIEDPLAWSDVSESPSGDDVESFDKIKTGNNKNKASSKGLDKAAYSDRIVILEGNGEGHGDFTCADHAINFLRKNKDNPFFLGCGFVKPHSPPTAPQRFFDLYNPDAFILPEDFASTPTVPPGFPSSAIRKRNADLFIGRPSNPVEARKVIQAYLASISWTDWNIGRVIAELDRLNLRKNTIIVFVADHGYHLGEKGKWSKAGSLFEMGTRVPTIIAAPKALGNGTSCNQITQSVSLYPTLAELCGLDLPSGIESSSITHLLNYPRAPHNDPAFSVWSEDSKTLYGVAIRKGKWRYAEYGPNGRNGCMLLDLERDPFELNNVVSHPENKSIIKELSLSVRTYAAKLKISI
jgi:arylsulfatase A-like enzyme